MRRRLDRERLADRAPKMLDTRVPFVVIFTYYLASASDEVERWTLHWFSDNSGYLLAVAGFITVAATRGRKILRSFSDFADTARTNWRAPRLITEEVITLKNDLAAVKLALGPGGGQMLADNVSYLMAMRDLDFERLHYPAFRCDNQGRNEKVTAAYRLLVGLSRNEDLLGREWENCVASACRASYYADWSRAAACGVTFTSEVSIQHPRTREDRGKWVVEATPIVVGARVTYKGRFVAPADAVARKIAAQFGWNMDFDESPRIPDIVDIRELLRHRAMTRNCVNFPMVVGGFSLQIPVSKDWEEVLPDLLPHFKIRWVSSSVDSTIFEVRNQGGAPFPLHFHSGVTERIDVGQGRILDVDSGTAYTAGQYWEVGPDIPHRCVFYNVSARITLSPACPSSTGFNIQLEGVEHIAEHM